MIIAITNQKGGVGKTTLSTNLSSSLALLGYRVLMIDMDPQGNATEGLGIKATNCDYTTYDVLIDHVPVAEAVVQHDQDNLYVLPSDMSLFGAEAVLAQESERHFFLQKALKAAQSKYDYILIDCPPNLGILTINAMLASTDIIVPLEPNAYALKGMSGLFNALHKVQDELNCYPNLLGIAINMFNPINSLHNVIIDNVIESFPPGKIFSTKVERYSIISEAEIHGQSVIQFAPKTKAADTFINLATEIIDSKHAKQQTREAKAIR